MNIEKKVKVKFLAASAPDELANYIESKGYSVRRVEPLAWLPDGIADHPDLRYCRMGVGDDAPIVIAPEELDAESTANDMCKCTKIIIGSSFVGPEYPADIPYNAACTGKFLICNAAYTAGEILDAAKGSSGYKGEAAGMALVDVKQGYAKCSTVVVDERSIITYDRGIAKAASTAGMDVLVVAAGHVELRGYNTGFIGGASGRVGDEIIFNGDLTAHPDFEAIRLFIEERGLKCTWFEGWPLTDVGSIV